MTEDQEQIDRLQEQLDELVRTQIDFQKDVSSIRAELSRLRANFSVPATTPLTEDPPKPPQPKPPIPESPPAYTPRLDVATPPPAADARQPATNVAAPSFGYDRSSSETRSSSGSRNAFNSYVADYVDSARGNLEKFIGENLISKIGIIILVLGVGIGAKYAIDNGWISPLMRIVAGYLIGFGLLGLAVRLKLKYLNFSSVLVSGAMAILYFVTYFAYAAYSLIGQPTAFGLMAIFTAFTVAASLLYNRQFIAHLGLVGAYAVPFLLSDDSGRYVFLFSYMAVLNLGILAISLKKYWTPLFYTSSGFTWLIFGVWFASKYSAAEHFYLALVFLAIFFATFYATKIVHGVILPESDDHENLTSIFLTTFVFYGFCFSIIDVRADVREYASFFTYLAVISLAIILTSYRFYGRVLIYLAYPFTWLIFGVWFSTKYNAGEHFMLASVFAFVFFATFYGATLVYRLVTDDIGMVENMALVLTNSFVFYGFGYAILDSRQELRSFEGLFTAAHAAFHSLVAQVVSRVKAGAIDVVQVLAILIITFSTVAIPIQFDGNRITLIWSVEAAALFWFGRVRQIRLFEYFSYPIMLLATVSLFTEWSIAFAQRTTTASEFNREPLMNGDFVTALMFVSAFAFIYITNRDKRHEPAIDTHLLRPFGYAVAGLGLFVLYNTFRIEISNYFHLWTIFVRSNTSVDTREIAWRLSDVADFNFIWQFNYTVAFITTLLAVNMGRIRSSVLQLVSVVLACLCLLIFTTAVMYVFYDLRLGYFMWDAGVYRIGTVPLNFLIRYVVYAVIAGLYYVLYRSTRDEMVTDSLSDKLVRPGFDALLYTPILVAASCELINLMVQMQIPDGSKLGLSILWGVYALALIVIGIAFNKTHLRIAAIVLLAVTLIKLFFYDIADLPTIPKTILFLSLGVLLLVISFLYNKYKAVIFKTATADDET